MYIIHIYILYIYDLVFIFDKRYLINRQTVNKLYASKWNCENVIKVVFYNLVSLTMRGNRILMSLSAFFTSM